MTNCEKYLTELGAKYNNECLGYVLRKANGKKIFINNSMYAKRRLTNGFKAMINAIINDK